MSYNYLLNYLEFVVEHHVRCSLDTLNVRNIWFGILLLKGKYVPPLLGRLRDQHGMDKEFPSSYQEFHGFFASSVDYVVALVQATDYGVSNSTKSICFILSRSTMPQRAGWCTYMRCNIIIKTTWSLTFSHSQLYRYRMGKGHLKPAECRFETTCAYLPISTATRARTLTEWLQLYKQRLAMK